MKSGDNCITIELPKGLKLVAEQNIDPEYQNEIYVGIETPNGIWHQDLVVIRNAYSIDDSLIVNWNPGENRHSHRPHHPHRERTFSCIPYNDFLYGNGISALQSERY